MCFPGDPNLTNAAANIKTRRQNELRGPLGLDPLPLIDLANINRATGSRSSPVQSSRSAPRRPAARQNSLQIGRSAGASRSGAALNIPR